MPETVTQERVRVGADGRLVIPAPLRKALGIRGGDELVVRVENGQLIIERLEDLRRRIKGYFAHVSPEVSLVDQLIAERRQEAAGE